MLGEIHVALLKLVIKDIEDVARTPSSGLGMNQNGAANPGGGHPQIVEGVNCPFILNIFICFTLKLPPLHNFFLNFTECFRHTHGALTYATGRGT